jgi:hypothetical protein
MSYAIAALVGGAVGAGGRAGFLAYRDGLTSLGTLKSLSSISQYGAGGAASGIAYQYGASGHAMAHLSAAGRSISSGGLIGQTAAAGGLAMAATPIFASGIRNIKARDVANVAGSINLAFPHPMQGVAQKYLEQFQGSALGRRRMRTLKTRDVARAAQTHVVKEYGGYMPAPVKKWFVPPTAKRKGHVAIRRKVMPYNVDKHVASHKDRVINGVPIAANMSTSTGKATLKHWLSK